MRRETRDFLVRGEEGGQGVGMTGKSGARARKGQKESGRGFGGQGEAGTMPRIRGGRVIEAERW